MILEPPCLIVLVVYFGLYFTFGGRQTSDREPFPPKRTILLSSVHKTFLHISSGHFECSLAKAIRLVRCLDVISGTFLGLQAFKSCSRRQWQTVCTDASIFKSFFCSVAGLKGSFFAWRTKQLTMKLVMARFCPRFSGFSS